MSNKLKIALLLGSYIAWTICFIIVYGISLKPLGAQYVIGGGGGTASNPITIDMQLSRSTELGSCVAPCAVHMDASGTVAASITSFPFHELNYSTNWGNAGAGTWTYYVGNSDKNVSYGPLAAHVYENPGVYTVTLTVKGQNTTTGAWIYTATKTATITVSDPDVVFSGTNTECLSNTTDHTGCPSGAMMHDNVTTFAAVVARIANNKRILMKRGDVFTFATSGPVPTSGRSVGILGAYGSGAKPIVRFTGPGSVSAAAFSSAGSTDWRYMDIELDSGNYRVGLIGITNGTKDFLALRLSNDATKLTGFGPSAASPTLSENIFFVENDVRNFGFGVAGSFAGGGTPSAINKFAWIGNRIATQTSTPPCRNGEAGFSQYTASIAGITMTVNSVAVGTLPNGQAVYCTGCQPGTTIVSGPGGGAGSYFISPSQLVSPPTTMTSGNCGDFIWRSHRAQKGVVSNNYFGDSLAGTSVYRIHGDTGVGSSQIITSDNLIYGSDGAFTGSPTGGIVSVDTVGGLPPNTIRTNLIFERNWLSATPMISSPFRTSNATLVTVRNNILVNGTNTFGFIFGTIFWTATEPLVNNVWWYNNTFYSDSTGVEQRGFYLGEIGLTMGLVAIRNHIVYLKNCTVTCTLSRVNGTQPNLISSNNTTQISGGSTVQTNPMFVISPPIVPTNFALQPSSYAKGGGTIVPVYDDIVLTPRISPYSIGAYQ